MRCKCSDVSSQVIHRGRQRITVHCTASLVLDACQQVRGLYKAKREQSDSDSDSDHSSDSDNSSDSGSDNDSDSGCTQNNAAPSDLPQNDTSRSLFR